MNFFGSLVFVFLTFGIIRASDNTTAQIPDVITYLGEEYNLTVNPLEPYFDKHPNKRPDAHSIALWRGYIGHFEIIDKQLYVTDITVPKYYTDDEGKSKVKSVSIFNDIFSEKSNVKIDWFTGILIIPYGELIEYVHMGYASEFSDYYLLEIDGGNFTRQKNLKQKAFQVFKNKQFEAFKKTEVYIDQLRSLKEDFGDDDEFIESFLRDAIINFTSKFLVD